ncbi:MAG: glycosyltransferase [Novosphingobium sp.]|nr:glycosyltransferase [Novosphingobium sp.]
MASLQIVLEGCLAFLAAIFAILALHPLFTYPFSLSFARDRTQKVALPADAPRPTLAICMCAYNEAQVITAKMDRLLEIARLYGPATVHVYADAPSDGTTAILQGYADRADIVVGSERAGKTFGMNLLVSRSSSEMLLFTDANVESEPDVAIQLLEALADPAVGCATARLVYSNSSESPTSALGSLYWSIEEAIKRIESRSVGLVGCDGAMFMMRRSLHIAPSPDLIDDLYLSLSILISGQRIVSVEHVKVFERSATGATEEKRRKQRIACQAWNVHRALWPRLRKLPMLSLYAYISHRPIKWLMPFFVAAMVLCLLLIVGVQFGAVAMLAAAGALAASFAIGGIAPIPPFSLLHSATLSLYGVAVGFFESWWMGKTYTIWQPAMTVRSMDPSPAPSEPPQDDRSGGGHG